RDQERMKFGFENRTVFTYCGSLGSWHDPFLLARIYKSIAETLSNTFLFVITTFSKEKLEGIFSANQIPQEQFRIINAKASDVPRLLSAADFGIIPLREINGTGPIQVVAETMIGTKVAEYLAS